MQVVSLVKTSVLSVVTHSKPYLFQSTPRVFFCIHLKSFQNNQTDSTGLKLPLGIQNLSKVMKTLVMSHFSSGFILDSQVSLTQDPRGLLWNSHPNDYYENTNMILRETKLVFGTQGGLINDTGITPLWVRALENENSRLQWFDKERYIKQLKMTLASLF